MKLWLIIALEVIAVIVFTIGYEALKRWFWRREVAEKRGFDVRLKASDEPTRSSDALKDKDD
jgi:hypothetical protein